ncbi:D-alanyl-D-alanine carboxypeptidase family protein [Streptomyces sp. NRRL F-5126]|uniref:D-alanyl-D-alanine carboxypeptidase family protein n=1 Tax=Streptomyces sp. NRRL F-5126 TaxID=1463857 RepID=UPI0004C64DD8|nr:D-alanyl-D-alanine carboxypeptidase [Streptomyces sp. NRRL F-5126]
MFIRSATRSALTGTAALAAGLLVLLPGSARAAVPARSAPALAVSPPAQPRADPLPPAPAPPYVDSSALYDSGTQAKPAPGTPAPPGDISALSWLVADADTGDVLAADNAHRKLPPASTLKTLFALTVMPHLSASSRRTVTQADLSGIDPGASMVGIVPGESYQVPDLWRGVFLSSGSDAVHALAAMNGGWDATVTQMQREAKRLGARDTHVVSCDGYDHPGQVSSAFDLAVFGRAGLSNPQFAAYASTRDAQFPGKPGETFGIQNTNRLLSGAHGVQTYPGMIGVKNGYTTHAGNTLIAAARHGDRTILVTVMNPQSGESEAVYNEARELLDWGFEADGHATPVGSLRPPPRVQAAGADGTRSAHGAAPAARHGRVAEASGAGGSSGFLLPMALIGAAALASGGLFALRRVSRRRRTAG